MMRGPRAIGTNSSGRGLTMAGRNMRRTVSRDAERKPPQESNKYAYHLRHTNLALQGDGHSDVEMRAKRLSNLALAADGYAFNRRA
jgi:hypothetical protein